MDSNWEVLEPGSIKQCLEQGLNKAVVGGVWRLQRDALGGVRVAAVLRRFFLTTQRNILSQIVNISSSRCYCTAE